MEQEQGGLYTVRMLWKNRGGDIHRYIHGTYMSRQLRNR